MIKKDYNIPTFVPVEMKINRMKNKVYRKYFKKSSPSYRLFFFDHTRKLIYIENPKAASRSILNLFGTLQEKGLRSVYNSVKGFSVSVVLPSLLHLGRARLMIFNHKGMIRETRDWIKKKEEDTYKTFTFVRNPFDRVVSGFCNKIVSDSPIGVPFRQPHKTWKDFLDGSTENNSESFKVFVEKYITEYGDRDIDVHFKSQHSMLDNVVKNPISFVGKVENFKEDWHKLCEQFDIPKEDIPLENQSSNKKDYRSYYSDIETIDLVYNRYKEDVRKYGYEKEYEELKKYVQKK